MTLTAATPVRLADLLDVDHLAHLVDRRLVSCRAHPTAPLRIYDYTPRATYSGAWDHETRLCRGLVVDGDGYVVARPFAKFFSVSEHAADPLPAEGTVDVHDKLDGSLGILYPSPAGPAIATRGSFDSRQARWATEHYRRHYLSHPLGEGATYLFEIIYPDNRFIVDYGSMADLVLLAVIDNATGADRSLPDGWPGPVVARRELGVDALAQAVGSGEGYVVRFAPADPTQPSRRVKVKFEEYGRLHRLMTGLTARGIWERLAADQPLEPLLAGAPDHFVGWVFATAGDLHDEYRRVELACREAASSLPSPRGALTAACVSGYGELAPVIFKMLDDRRYDQLIWRVVRPPGDTRFRPDLER